MFTGIVESTGHVQRVHAEGSNLRLHVQAPFANELKIDQSVAHNGVCLTVVALHPDSYEVVAVAETLDRSNLGRLAPGAALNLERCLVPGARLDGHFVQGHVDTQARLRSVTDVDGSSKLWFDLDAAHAPLVVEKGSIAVNGVSLTVVDAPAAANGWGFSVVVIPYTWTHTNLAALQAGDAVNIEFDILGKYVQRQLQLAAANVPVR